MAVFRRRFTIATHQQDGPRATRTVVVTIVS